MAVSKENGIYESNRYKTSHSWIHNVRTYHRRGHLSGRLFSSCKGRSTRVRHGQLAHAVTNRALRMTIVDRVETFSHELK